MRLYCSLSVPLSLSLSVSLSLQFQDEVTSINEKLAEVEKLNASLRAANQDLNFRLVSVDT